MLESDLAASCAFRVECFYNPSGCPCDHSNAIADRARSRTNPLNNPATNGLDLPVAQRLSYEGVPPKHSVYRPWIDTYSSLQDTRSGLHVINTQPIAYQMELLQDPLFKSGCRS